MSKIVEFPKVREDKTVKEKLSMLHDYEISYLKSIIEIFDLNYEMIFKKITCKDLKEVKMLNYESRIKFITKNLLTNYSEVYNRTKEIIY
ncbi:MAG: hypothetical protein ACRDD7_08345 [Peptostreptococcaceae bacterium]